MVERLLSPSDAARILGVVPATVRAMAISGRLPPATMTESGIRLFRREDVERLAAERAERERQDSVSATVQAQEAVAS
ncbi:MAG: helix-turn-helix domain-containing protein [Chloroflexia bacterium]|nr:helix-turn-helix domain-containing protein [Chloroflexia bacterium]